MDEETDVDKISGADQKQGGWNILAIIFMFLIVVLIVGVAIYFFWPTNSLLDDMVDPAQSLSFVATSTIPPISGINGTDDSLIPRNKPTEESDNQAPIPEFPPPETLSPDTVIIPKGYTGSVSSGILPAFTPIDQEDWTDAE